MENYTAMVDLLITFLFIAPDQTASMLLSNEAVIPADNFL